MLRRITVTLVLLVFTAQAFGSQSKTPVTLDLALELNGQLISKPKIIVLMGQTAKISEESPGSKSGYSIEATPSLKESNVVLLDLVVSQMSDGKSKVLGRPSVVVLNGESATIEQNSPGEPTLKIQVKPTF